MHPFLVFKAKKKIINFTEDTYLSFINQLLEFVENKFSNEDYTFEYERSANIPIIRNIIGRSEINKKVFIKSSVERKYHLFLKAVHTEGPCSFKEKQGLFIDVVNKKNAINLEICDNMWLPHSAKYDENGDVKITPEEWQVYYDRSVKLIRDMKNAGLIDSYKNNLEVEGKLINSNS